MAKAPEDLPVIFQSAGQAILVSDVRSERVSVAAIARVTGVGKRSALGWLRGARKPSDIMKHRIFEAFGTPEPFAWDLSGDLTIDQIEGACALHREACEALFDANYRTGLVDEHGRLTALGRETLAGDPVSLRALGG